MKDVMKLLREKKCSLVVKSCDGVMYGYYGRGVSDLYGLLRNDPTLLAGATVADKVVGKGAAALMIQGRVKALNAVMISIPALELLGQSPIKVNYQIEVNHILNYSGDGICPIEQLCMPCKTAAGCVELIRMFMQKKR